MQFTKMQGLGNDFLIVRGPVPENAAKLSRFLCDRHFGAGGDGVIFLSPSDTADADMRIFNSDGSEAAMCGNGIRCAGKYLYDNGLVSKETMTVSTRSGVKTLFLKISRGKAVSVSVDMGKAVLLERDVPLPEGIGTGTAVSTGNPHMVVFSEDAEIVPLLRYGPAIERDGRFPGGINAEFIQVLSPTLLRMRVWERGCGVTLACGTGACAAVFAAVKHGFCPVDTPVEVRLDGGRLFITLDREDHLQMEGPAVTVYEGEVYDTD